MIKSKRSYKSINICKRWMAGASSMLLTGSVFASDKLAGAMTGDIQDMLGSSGSFWKAFILVDIILAAAALIKTKNPMVFLSVLAVAIIPGFLMNVFVF
jgi:hypothetical protein